MRHLDLFSGIGGFALAARWMGWQTVQFVEIEPFCQAVLKKNFPNTPIHGDIKTFAGTNLRGSIDILTGGFPCQPFSSAGERKGIKDNRYLWPEMLRVIGEVQPRFIVGENVSGLLNWSNGMVFEQVQIDLENQGYETTPFLLPASGKGKFHIRERIWFVANSISMQPKQQIEEGYRAENGHETEGSAFETWIQAATKFCGVDDGVPNRMDRIKSLGNAIVPQVAFEIFKAIEQIKP
jgi:DNA (cytosine-5)-methyltransferase 1